MLCTGMKLIQKVYYRTVDGAGTAITPSRSASDRCINDYYEHLVTGKHRKSSFHELIVQIGNKDDMRSLTENGALAKNCWTSICRASRT